MRKSLFSLIKVAHINRLLSLGDGLIAESKEIQALGAFDGQHRSQALDMLGYEPNSR